MSNKVPMNRKRTLRPIWEGRSVSLDDRFRTLFWFVTDYSGSFDGWWLNFFKEYLENLWICIPIGNEIKLNCLAVKCTLSWLNEYVYGNPRHSPHPSLQTVGLPQCRRSSDQVDGTTWPFTSTSITPSFVQKSTHNLTGIDTQVALNP